MHDGDETVTPPTESVIVGNIHDDKGGMEDESLLGSGALGHEHVSRELARAFSNFKLIVGFFLLFC